MHEKLRGKHTSEWVKLPMHSQLHEQWIPRTCCKVALGLSPTVKLVRGICARGSSSIDAYAAACVSAMVRPPSS